MITKKIFAGAVVAALGLSITTVAFAAETQKTMVTQGMEYQNDVSLSNEGVISFEESDLGNLPDGAEHHDTISMGGEGAVSFEEADWDNLPDGAEYQDETSTTTEGLIYFEAAN